MASAASGSGALSVGDQPATLLDVLLTSHKLSTDVTASQSTQAYLAQLTSLPLATLQTEPGRLATEADLLTTDLTQLCHAQHTTFLSLHTASKSLASSLTSLTSSLDTVITSAIPVIEQSAREFTARTRSIQESRQKSRLVLDHHDKLLDILQLPQLLNTCVQNGYYTEALDLAAHFERKLLDAMPENQLLRSLETSVRASVQTLLSQLLQQLHNPAKLPVLFKTVGLLRRMEVMPEEELAMAFLHGRASCLQGMLADGAGAERDRVTDPALWLKKWVEVSREGVYDVVTQYSTIFLSPPTSTSTKTLPSATPWTPLPSLRPLLTSFTQTFINRLLSLLGTTLPLIPVTDMASLSSLLTQLSYCASSFSRIGLDFRGALPPLIEAAVLAIITRGFTDAQSALAKSIGDAKRGRKRPSEWLIVQESMGNPPLGASRATSVVPPMSPTRTTRTTAHQPPLHISSYPLLATLTNDILQTLNSLRLLAPPSLLPHLRSALLSVLSNASGTVLSYCRESVAALESDRRRSGEDKESEEDREKRVTAAIGVVLWDESDGVVGYLSRALSVGVYSSPVTDGDEGEDGVQLSEGKREWVEWMEAIGATVLIDSLKEEEVEHEPPSIAENGVVENGVPHSPHLPPTTNGSAGNGLVS